MYVCLFASWFAGSLIYSCDNFSDETFFPGRCAQVIVNGKPIGIMGVLHPEVVSNFELNLPCAVLELDVEEFL